MGLKAREGTLLYLLTISGCGWKGLLCAVNGTKLGSSNANEQFTHTVQKKNTKPIIFSFIPRKMCGFIQKWQWIYLRGGLIQQVKTGFDCSRWRNYDATFDKFTASKLPGAQHIPSWLASTCWCVEAVVLVRYLEFMTINNLMKCLVYFLARQHICLNPNSTTRICCGFVLWICCATNPQQIRLVEFGF